MRDHESAARTLRNTFQLASSALLIESMATLKACQTFSHPSSWQLNSA